jgi:elongation factor G
MAYATTDIRNLALVGHAAAGKTTLVEALLAAAGRIPASRGVSPEGNTVCDFDPLEIEKGHSLDTALVSFDWHGSHINLIDTPGAPDFLGKAVPHCRRSRPRPSSSVRVTVSNRSVPG